MAHRQTIERVHTMPSDTIDDNETETNGANGRVWKYGKFDIDFDKLPANVVDEALRRAFTHVLSNEAKSKSGSATDKMISEGALSNEADSVASKRAELEDEYRAAYIQAFYDGSWGEGRRGPSGPRVDALETEYNRAVTDAVRAYMRAEVANNRISYDKANKQWFWVDETSNNRETRTIDEASANYEASLSDEERAAFMEQAREAVAFKQRKLEQAKTAQVRRI